MQQILEKGSVQETEVSRDLLLPKFAIDQWLYANVYDPFDGETWLKWWES